MIKLNKGDKIILTTGYTHVWGEDSMITGKGELWGYSKSLGRVALLGFESTIKTIERNVEA